MHYDHKLKTSTIQAVFKLVFSHGDELIFVRSYIHTEASRGGLETRALRFISGPQSIFCFASWCAAWTCRLQGHFWVPLPAPYPPVTTTAGQHPSAVQMTISVSL